jgi:hypothetical protein
MKFSVRILLRNHTKRLFDDPLLEARGTSLSDKLINQPIDPPQAVTLFQGRKKHSVQNIEFDIFTALSRNNAVFSDTETQFVPYRK